VLLAGLTQAEARNMVVALSPHADPAQKQVLIEKVMAQVLDRVEPGEQALFFDADTTAQIAAFAVPNRAAYANPRAKVQANKSALRALKSFIDAPRPETGLAQQADIAGLLTKIGQHYPAQAETDLFILAAPLHVESAAAHLSMVDGAVPGMVIHSPSRRNPLMAQRI
jgi:membrane-bound lytic murein transglycosylase B